MIKNPYKKANDGFTLIEVLMALAIAGIIMAALFMVFSSMSKSMSGENVRISLQQGLRSAVNMMAFDIRQAGLDPFKKGDFRIIKAKSDEIEFNSDINVNGYFETDERFRYYVSQSSKSLQFQGNGTPQPMISNIETLRFTFLDENGAALNKGDDPVQHPKKIRAVEIYVSAREKYWGGSGEEKKEYRTVVKCRNQGKI